MAITSNPGLGMYDSRIRLFGLGNNLFDTNELIEAELLTLEALGAPKKQQKALLEQEISVWKYFLNDFKALTDSFTELRFFETGKTISYSQENVVRFEADAGADEGEYKIRVNRLATNHQIASESVLDINEPLGIADTVQINGRTLEITADMTLRDIANSINEGDYGISASIIANRLVLTSKTSGENGAILLEDGANGILSQIGILNAEGTVAYELQKGQDAEFTINGIPVKTSENSVKNVLKGITIHLVDTSSGEIKVKVESDKAKILEAVENMVNAYNKAISRYKTYTDKGNYLQGQIIPLNIRKELGDMLSFVSADGKYLYQFGIEVDGVAKDGTLKIDKEQLGKMYEENPEVFKRMFFGNEGLGKYMEDKLLKFTGETGIINEKIESLNESLEKTNRDIEQFEIYYENQKALILAKYEELEAQLAKMNMLLEYMDEQLKSLTGDNN